MDHGANPNFTREFAAALGWWRDAGVDLDFLDAPRSWIAPEVKTPPPGARPSDAPPRRSAAPPAPSSPPPSAELPQDLAAFHAWWLSEPSLDSEHLTGRIAPRGSVDADLMVLVASPDEDDRERLLSGQQGRVLDAFLAAAGIEDTAVYRASILPCHSPGADWSGATAQVLAHALRHHVALARPRRLLVLGMHILPLLGHASAQGALISSIFNHEGMTIPMLAVRMVPAAASQPRWKSVLWRAWLDWTDQAA
jgi:DNA polymerase